MASLRELLEPMQDWTQNTSTQAEVKVFILDTRNVVSVHVRELNSAGPPIISPAPSAGRS